jgi:hypothetical protein
MKNDPAQIIDMTPEGEFVRPSPYRANSYGQHRYQPAQSRLSLGTVIVRLAVFGILIGLGMLLFWLAVFTLPVIFFGGLVLYGIYRFQMMRLRRGGGSDRRNSFIQRRSSSWSYRHPR